LARSSGAWLSACMCRWRRAGVEWGEARTLAGLGCASGKTSGTIGLNLYPRLRVCLRRARACPGSVVEDVVAVVVDGRAADLAPAVDAGELADVGGRPAEQVPE